MKLFIPTTIIITLLVISTTSLHARDWMVGPANWGVVDLTTGTVLPSWQNLPNGGMNWQMPYGSTDWVRVTVPGAEVDGNVMHLKMDIDIGVNKAQYFGAFVLPNENPLQAVEGDRFIEGDPTGGIGTSFDIVIGPRPGHVWDSNMHFVAWALEMPNGGGTGGGGWIDVTQPVPEPSLILLLGLGLPSVCLAGWRFRN